jgi:hypothetical protein
MSDINLKIKEEFKATVVGFNHSGLPLGERSDLHLLAEMAQSDPFLANLFEQLPAVEELAAYKEQLFLDSHPAPQEPALVVEETSTGDQTNTDTSTNLGTKRRR